MGLWVLVHVTSKDLWSSLADSPFHWPVNSVDYNSDANLCSTTGSLTLVNLSHNRLELSSDVLASFYSAWQCFRICMIAAADRHKKIAQFTGSLYWKQHAMLLWSPVMTIFSTAFNHILYTWVLVVTARASVDRVFARINAIKGKGLDNDWINCRDATIALMLPALVHRIEIPTYSA
jgi:hypothetical protein